MLPKILSGRAVIPPAGSCRRLVLNRTPEEHHASAHASLVHESGTVYRELMFGAVHVDAALARFTAERYGAPLELYPEHAHWILGEPGWEKVADRAAAWALDACQGVTRTAHSPAA